MDVFIYLWSTKKNYVVYWFVLIEKRKAKPSTIEKKNKKKTSMCPKLDASKRKKKKKKKKAKLSKEKKEKEKNKSGRVYIIYVEVAQSLVATSCYYLFDLMFRCSS